MTNDRCDHWHGLIAMEVVGQLETDQLFALDAHSDQCPACRQERQNLLPLAGALAGTDSRHLDATELPITLQESVLGFLRSSERRRAVVKRRHRAAILVGTVAAVSLAILGVVLSVGGTSSGQTVALSGPGATQASVTFTPESWGTSVHLTESDARMSSMLTVWMQTGSGSWWEAGTYWTSKTKSVQVAMACAVRASAVSRIVVRNAQGRTVLRGSVP